MHDDPLDKAKQAAQNLGKQIGDGIERQRERLSPQAREALLETQAQTQEALSQIGGLLKVGARKARAAAEAAAQAIRDDIGKRPG
ncbi:MAG: hypothetical protein ACYDEW_06570 [Vulcanimicrobiaceae bacterium]